jgi:hypothetical protein
MLPARKTSYGLETEQAHAMQMNLDSWYLDMSPTHLEGPRRHVLNALRRQEGLDRWGGQ